MTFCSTHLLQLWEAASPWDQSQTETSRISHSKHSLCVSYLSQALHFNNGKITDIKAREKFLTVGSKEQAEKHWWDRHWLLKPVGQKLDESCVIIYVQNIWQKSCIN